MSVERRCKQIAMNCAAYRTHEDSDLSPGSCLDCAHYDASGMAVSLISMRKSIAA